MNINLSRMSDAELGALVRRSMTDDAITRVIASSAVAKEAARARREDVDRAAIAERAERKRQPGLGEIVVNGKRLTLPDLTDLTLDELAPTTVAEAYRSIIQPPPEVDPDTMEVVATWRQVVEAHGAWRNRATPSTGDPESEQMVEALVRVSGLTIEEARERVARLAGARATSAA